MSLSDPLKSLPVVHHFYPINPQTALQQQSAVYNTPDHLLVAPILPASSQPCRDAHSNSNKKQKMQEVDSEVQHLGIHPPGSLSQKTKSSKRRQVKLIQEPTESNMICLGPRQQRRIPYVDLPDHRSINLTLYRPISLASPASQLLLGWGRHHNRSRNVSQTSFGESVISPPSPDPSTVSEYLHPGDSIRTGERKQSFRGKNAESGMKAKDLAVIEDEASTCHQCRRKTTKEKMHCRRLRPDGTVCPYLFCDYCIAVRYDEIFDSFHPTWHCPRCRGICNCSICLRKAGFGYILDGSMSEQFTGTQGRLSVAGQGKKRSRNGTVKKGDQCDEEQPRVSVRAWLARKGIALGTEEWMMERRRQGVRYVVGKSPPPPDDPSPYMEAQSNPTIAACTEYIEDDIDDISNEKPSCEGDADTLISSGPLTLNHSDAIAMSSTQEKDSNPKSLPPDIQPNSGTLNDVTAVETHEETGSHTLPLSFPDVNTSAFPTSSEDLPGLCSALTHGIRLVVGKPLPTSKKKRQLKTPKVKKPKATKARRPVDVDISDSDYDDITQQDVGLPAIRVRGCNPSTSGLRMKSVRDEEEEEKDTNRGSSLISDIFYSPLHADEIFSPPPAEPVLVPTEYYAPSKLDGTIAKGSQAQFGHTYWSFNAVTPHQGLEHNDRGAHGSSSSSLLMSTPLYSNNDRHPYPPFSMGDVCPAGPSARESTSAPASRNGAYQSPSESTTLSNSHTPDDYLNLQVHTHARDVDAYTAHSLAAFTTLDETWPPVGMDAYPNLPVDMSPLQMEGITHAMDDALHNRQCDQP